MRKTVSAVILCICLASLLLYGCAAQDNTPKITESQIWESAPALSFGTMAYEKLKVEPWYSGRCEATGNSLFAETELGYYLSSYGKLYYADKTNLTLWVPVCNQPDCSHSMRWSYGQVRCNAYIDSFVIRDGRIYFADMVSTLWDHYSMVSSSDGLCIASRALDGTDLRLEYKNEDMNISGGGSSSYILDHTQWLVSISNLNQDGSETHQLYRVTDGGASLYSEHTALDSFTASSLHGGITAYGDQTFFHYFLDESSNLRYRFVGEKLAKYDLSGIDTDGQYYLAGNQVRLYRQNDGYYDMDLTTREQLRVADAQFADGFSHIVLPNCIIETTLSHASWLDSAPCEAHAMKLFNGETWLDVPLPPEISTPGKMQYMSVAGITSDSIFLCFVDLMYVTHLYRIPLNTDAPTLEFCAKLR